MRAREETHGVSQGSPKHGLAIAHPLAGKSTRRAHDHFLEIRESANEAEHAFEVIRLREKIDQCQPVDFVVRESGKQTIAHKPLLNVGLHVTIPARSTASNL